MTETEQRIRANIARIRELFDPSKEPTKESEKETADIVLDLVGTALVDLHRIANAADRIRGR